MIGQATKMTEQGFKIPYASPMGNDNGLMPDPSINYQAAGESNAPTPGASIIDHAGRIASYDGGSIANIIDGAQFGYGNHLENIDADTPLVLRPVLPVVLRAPTWFQRIPYFPDYLAAMMRMTQRIEGVDLEYTMDSAEVPAGYDGQMKSVPVNTRRNQISPSLTITDVTGAPVWNFIREWMIMMRDPDTASASLAGVIPSNVKMSNPVFSDFTMDVAILQPSIDMRPENLIACTILTGMYPEGTGPMGMTKDLGTGNVANRTIPFRAFYQHNRNTLYIGQMIMDALQLHRYNYDFAPPLIDGIASNLQDTGLAKESAYDAANFGPRGGNAAMTSDAV